MVSTALMTLGNSICVLLPTALLSDRIPEHDVCCEQPCLVLGLRKLFQLLRGAEAPGYVTLYYEGLARAHETVS